MQLRVGQGLQTRLQWMRTGQVHCLPLLKVESGWGRLRWGALPGCIS